MVEGSRIQREYPITHGRIQGAGKRGKSEIADYVLVYRNTKLAVIEAKALVKHYSEGVAQAKGYAQKLAVRFTYSTNGQAIYCVDMRSGVEGDVANFPGPEQLWALNFSEQSEWRERFAAIPFEDKGGTWGARCYQDIAISRVLEAIAAERQRILLTLATGTGRHGDAENHDMCMKASRPSCRQQLPSPASISRSAASLCRNKPEHS